MTLTKETRQAIGRAVQRLRALFEEEFSQQASGRFGLHTQPRSVGESSASSDNDDAFLQSWVEPLNALALTPSQIVQRRELVGAVAYLLREGSEGGGAVARVIREAAFTATNQLLAVRVAEAIGVLPEVTANARLSSGYREIIRELFPLLSQDEDEGFWTYVQVCGDELGASVPLLFDRRLPTAAFAPSRACVDSALAIINDPAVAAAWSEPEALGWAYQFFNREDERQVMRAESSVPRTSRELAVRNQFFTPRYVVDWLVQNTLGRRLREAGYLLDLPLLVGSPGESAPLELDDVRVLDPAVGSGHFLLGCYDLLEQAWASIGISAEEAAPRILRCLHGLEIDARASQVAQAVLILRARRAAPHADLKPPLIVTARPLPHAPDIKSTILKGLSENARDLLEDLTDGLTAAADLGTLLKIDLRLAALFKQAMETPKLADEVTADLLERELLNAVVDLTNRADSSPAARLFAADAQDAIRFVQLSQLRYDAVLMNPPFGDPVPATKEYLTSAYGGSAVDLYAAFVERGVELLNERGYMGAITSRTGFFLTSFQSWRGTLVLPRLRALIDLGTGVMHDAMVEAAAYVLSRVPHSGEAAFRRLLDAKDKAASVYEEAPEVFLRRPQDFSHIRGSPAAYWLEPSLLGIFKSHDPIDESSGVEARRGPATGDDFRYIRCWWEVPISGAFGKSPRWVSFAKGGEYSPFYSNIHLVIDWDYERGTFRGFEGRKGRPTPIPENRNYFGRPGLTWSRRSQKGFAVRPVPAGCIFSDKGPMIFAASDRAPDLDRIMAYMNSRLAAALLEGIVVFGSYEVGAVQRLPFIAADAEAGQLAEQLTRARMLEAERDETDHLFTSPWGSAQSMDVELPKIAQRIDELMNEAIDGVGGIEPLSVVYPSRWLEDEYRLRDTPTAHDEISYLLGVALGRWDLRMGLGLMNPGPLPTPYEPLPPAARGMLVTPEGLPGIGVPDDYPIQIPSDRMLHDEHGHPRDVVKSLATIADFLRSGDHPRELRFPDEVRDLRQHLRQSFYQNHLRRYSASHRYAPIYWYLSIPSREWGLWIYAPALSREMLFAIASAARDKQRRLSEQVRQLRDQLDGGANRDAVKRLELSETVMIEVEAFAERAEHVAQSGWEPDLNDGLILCAAPLEMLFADEGWRGRVASVRKDMENGNYPWASVQGIFFGGTP